MQDIVAQVQRLQQEGRIDEAAARLFCQTATAAEILTNMPHALLHPGVGAAGKPGVVQLIP